MWNQTVLVITGAVDCGSNTWLTYYELNVLPTMSRNAR